MVWICFALCWLVMYSLSAFMFVVWCLGVCLLLVGYWFDCLGYLLAAVCLGLCRLCLRCWLVCCGHFVGADFRLV